MSQDLESAQARLANIQTVSPILSALRTISLGSWQMSLNRRGELQRYSTQLLALLPIVLPHISMGALGARWLAVARALRTPAPHGALGICNPMTIEGLGAPGASVADAPSAMARVRRATVLVIGSERGLCGRYNSAVLAQAEQHLATLAEADIATEVLAFGKRIITGLERRGVTLHEKRQMPITALPSFDMAFALVSRWMQRYEAYTLDAVDIVYNAYVNAGVYISTVTRLLPPSLPASGPTALNTVIVETDPTSLYARIVEQWSALRLYDLLLEAAASEHAARFQLMESATQNTENLIEDLTQVIQSARRQAITREMQELAAGAEVVGG